MASSWGTLVGYFGAQPVVLSFLVVFCIGSQVMFEAVTYIVLSVGIYLKQPSNFVAAFKKLLRGELYHIYLQNSFTGKLLAWYSLQDIWD